MTAIDAEARAVIGRFVAGQINENAILNWLTAERWDAGGDEVEDSVSACTRILFGESTVRRERERLSAIYFGPDTARWHSNNDWDEQEER